MNCERSKELFADALAETLDETTKGELEAHLARCMSCSEEPTSLQSTWAKSSSLPEQNPSPALDERVQATLEAYREEMKQPERLPVPSGAPPRRATETVRHCAVIFNVSRDYLSYSRRNLAFAIIVTSSVCGQKAALTGT